MEFLRLLAFVAVWGFMWRWVVKNRGNWNIFYGNIVGAAGGVIVALVMLSITLSLYPMADEPEKNQAEKTVVQNPSPNAVMPEAESAPVAAPAPAPVLAPTPAPAPVASSNLPAYVASKPQNEASPPDSALLPFYSKRMATSMSEQKLEDGLGKNFTTLRQMMGTDPNADKSVMAAVMCVPFVQRAMRFPAAAAITQQPKANSTLFKDQTYTITNTVTGRNMLGDDVLYRFDCSIQQQPINESGYADWRLLDLKLQKAGS